VILYIPSIIYVPYELTFVAYRVVFIVKVTIEFFISIKKLIVEQFDYAFKGPIIYFRASTRYFCFCENKPKKNN